MPASNKPPAPRLRANITAALTRFANITAALTRFAIIRFFTAGDIVLLVLQLGLILYYFGTRGIFQGKASGDGFFGFMFLPGVILHHSLDLGVPAPEWAHILGRERSGLVANGCPIGPVFLWLPFYLLGLLLQKIGLLLGALPLGGLSRLLSQRPITGREERDFFMAGLGALTAGLVGIRLAYDLIRRKLGVVPARFGALVATLASPLTFYLVTQPLYQHAAAFFGATLFVERWDAWRQTDQPMPGRRWAALGALGGVAMLMRQQEGLFFLLPGLDALYGLAASARARDRRQLVRWLGRGALFLAVAVLVYSPQLALWHHYYGAFRPPQEPGHFRWRDPALIESLFSMRAGLFPWVPALYLAIPGLWLARRQLGGLAGRLALVFALELWLNASVWDFYGSWTYGPRRYTDAVLTLALGLGGIYWWATRQGTRRRWLAAGLLVLAGALVLLNGTMMELVRQRRVKSSGAGAFPPAVWVRWAQGPAWLEQALSRVSYPFCQPAGWIWGAIHHVPARTFEAVVGNYLLERDWRSHGLVAEPAVVFAQDSPYVVEGIGPAPVGGWPRTGLLPCGPRVRVLVPLMGREPLRLRLSGALRGAERGITATWNGVPLKTGGDPGKDLLSAGVPAEIVRTRARTNELVFEGLPAGAALRRLDVESYTTWWRE